MNICEKIVKFPKHSPCYLSKYSRLEGTLISLIILVETSNQSYNVIWDLSERVIMYQGHPDYCFTWINGECVDINIDPYTLILETCVFTNKLDEAKIEQWFFEHV